MKTMEDLELIGGERTHVYLNREREEVLKLVAADDEEVRSERLAGFGRAFMTSTSYSPLGLMPEVLEVGANFNASGRPYLRERYAPGVRLDRGFLEDPDLWIRRLPEEIVRIYTTIGRGKDWSVRDRWEQKIDRVLTTPGLEKVGARVRQAGEWLRARSAPAYQIHGDLRLDSLGETEGRIILFDWEKSEVMTFAYEFAMLRASLAFPEVFFSPELREAYRRNRKLSRLWKQVLRALPGSIANEEEISKAMLFRIGSAWLEKLDAALRAADTRAVEDWRKRLERLSKLAS